MKIHHELADRSERPTAVIAIGFFDGFHLGHQQMIRTLIGLRQAGEAACVLTFANHPATLLRPRDVPPMVSTLEERVDRIARAGVDELYLIPFDHDIAELTPYDFCEHILVEKLHARAIVVGENFRFGASRAGDVEFARNHLSCHNVQFVAIENVIVGNARVSSTRIRQAIAAGEIAEAEALLGYSYRMRGRVVLGAGRGHDLGFPTANVAIDPMKLLPPDAVYTATARYDGQDYAALVSIGTNPTFAGAQRTVEVWIRDFHQTIYGEDIALSSLRFVRHQRRFGSYAELRSQIEADAAETMGVAIEHTSVET